MPKTDPKRQSPTPIPEYSGLDRDGFLQQVVEPAKPAVFRGLVRDWPIVSVAGQGRDALIAYLRPFDQGQSVEAFFGAPELRGRFFHDETARGFNFEKRTLPLAAFFDQLRAALDQDNPPSIYAGGVNVPKHLPGLMAELAMPYLDPAHPLLTSLWIGGESRTAAHWDLPQNLACVVSGTRRFTVFPPQAVRGMYMGSFDFTLAGQPVSMVNPENPDLNAHPRYAEVMHLAQTVELHPGDVLYVPNLWLHQVDTAGPFGAMVNFWWLRAPDHLVTPYFTMLHAVLSLKGRPQSELDAWKHMFDHFVFEQDGPPFAHLPEGARGVFGDMDAGQLQNLRQFLSNTLRST